MEEASGIRQRLVKLLPWVITLAIFVFIFRRVPVPELLEALRQASLLPYLALMAPYSLVYCLVDAFVLTRAVGWFNKPVRYARILPVRAAAYILSLLNPGLGQGGTAFYLHRREGVPFFEMAGSIVFLVVIEFAQLALYAAIGIFIVQPELAVVFAPFYVIFAAAFALALAYVRRGLGPLARGVQGLCRLAGREVDPARLARPPAAPILRALQQAGVRHYLLALLYKAPNFFLAIVVHYLAVQQFGLQIPFLALLAFLPVVFLAASLPITVAHLGTSQAAWLFFFAAYGAEARLLAYSLAAHFTFMMLNSLIGLCFLKAALKTPPAAQQDEALQAGHQGHPDHGGEGQPAIGAGASRAGPGRAPPSPAPPRRSSGRRRRAPGGSPAGGAAGRRRRCGATSRRHTARRPRRSPPAARRSPSPTPRTSPAQRG